jgi:hypothetical protein
MTFSSFIILAASKHVSQEKKKILSSSFSFPADFCLKGFLYNTVIFFVCGGIHRSYCPFHAFYGKGC